MNEFVLAAHWLVVEIVVAIATIVLFLALLRPLSGRDINIILVTVRTLINHVIRVVLTHATSSTHSRIHWVEVVPSLPERADLAQSNTDITRVCGTKVKLISIHWAVVGRDAVTNFDCIVSDATRRFERIRSFSISITTAQQDHTTIVNDHNFIL